MPSNYGIDQAKIETLIDPRRLIELTTEDPGAIAPEAGVLDEIIEDAEGVFESYAGVYYETPVRLVADPASPPRVVVTTLLYAVGYGLMTRRPEFLDPDKEGAFWIAKWKEIRTWYERISAGPKRLAYIVGATEKDTSVLESSTGGAEAVCPTPGRFTRERLGDL